MAKLLRKLAAFALPGAALLIGGAAPIKWTEEEVREYDRRTALVESGQLLHKDKPSRKDFAKAQALGLRAGGVYWRTDHKTNDDPKYAITTHYIRFCSDGSVTGAVVIGEYQSGLKWLRCNPVRPDNGHGVIRVKKQTINFRMHMVTGSIDNAGVILPNPDRDLQLTIRTNIKSAPNYGTSHVQTYKFAPD